MAAAGAMTLRSAPTVLLFLRVTAGRAGISHIRFLATGLARFFIHSGKAAATGHFTLGKMVLQRETERLQTRRQRHEKCNSQQRYG